jgi:hypothetical protein
MSEEDWRLTIALQSEILKWIKVTSVPKVKTILESTLKTPEQKMAYQFSTGKKLLEVAKLANVSKSSVANWWESWARLGIAEMKSVRGGSRAIRSFSLEDFGIDVPKLTPNPKS